MLQNNSRIDQKNGMHFYEKDVIMLNYVYTNDVNVDLTVDYRHPGLGVVISEYKTGDIGDSNNLYLCRVGNNEYSILHRNLLSQEKVSGGAAAISPSDTENSTRVFFEKIGKKLNIYTYINNKEIILGSYTMPKDIEKYHIGFYSNYGNTIKSAVINNERPMFWFPNIKNTNGGRISFKHSSFIIEKAERPIEVEQQKIHLNKGTYFLKYSTNKINNKFDIKSYVFHYEDEEIDPKKKTLLSGKDNMFTLEEDCLINLFFRGTSGQISDICIVTDPQQSYVSTDEKTNKKDGSKAVIYLDNLSKITWRGMIEAIPYNNLNEKIKFFIIKYNNLVHFLHDMNIDLKQEYNFEIKKTENNTYFFSITNDNGEDLFHEEFTDPNNIVEFFYNIAGWISNVIITTIDGEEINILTQKTYKKYVPIEVQSPIIVIDENNIPFDLSSSYRYCLDTEKYVFTNWERELIINDNKSSQYLLEHEIMDSLDSVILYGIKSELKTFDNIFNVKSSEHMNSIDSISKGNLVSYDIIAPDLYTVTDNKVLDLSEEISSKNYKYYIFDYLKNNSYAINVVDNNTKYEIDISTSASKFTAMYDMMENGQIREYKVIDNIEPRDNLFITLKRMSKQEME